MKTDAGLTSRRMRCILKVAVVILLLALLAIPVFHQEIDDQSHFENILKAHGLIPDVIEDAPEAAILTVVFEGRTVVNHGDELAPRQAERPPVEVQWVADPNQYYTLIFADPDAPSRDGAYERSWQHWVVCNIPGTDITKGNTLTEYAPPTPPKDSGLHRYIFLVYLQEEGKADFKEPFIAKDNSQRGKFSAREFAGKHHLGKPIAINFFQAKSENS